MTTTLYDPDVADDKSRTDTLGRTYGRALTDDERAKLRAQQARLDKALAEVEAAQAERDDYWIELGTGDPDDVVGPTEIARALGMHRVTVARVLTNHRKAQRQREQ